MQSTTRHLIRKIFYGLRRWDQKAFYLLAVLAIAVTYTALGSALPSLAAPAEDTPAPEATLEGEPDQTPTPEPVSPEDEDPPQVPADPTESISASTEVYLPLVDTYRAPQDIAPESYLLCSNLGSSLNIPDNDPTGVRVPIQSPDNRFIHDIDVYLNIEHPWTGDLVVDLAHRESGSTVRLVDRPGLYSSTAGCSGDNLIAILDDQASQPIRDKCASTVPSIAGSFRPEQKLESVRGRFLAGTWTLSVADHSQHDTGKLVNWCMEVSVSASPPGPLPEPQPVALPSTARIYNISGQNQSMPLSCESRSAVDWARYFGVFIGEYDFFNRLPRSDNPDAGFVGSVYGTWGQIPPNPYGVHAEPVAGVLRDLGLSAYAHKKMSWDAVRAEVAAGRPVEVWIVGAANLVSGAYPVYYTAQDGHLSVVSRYEHTVLVIGYTPSEVILLNGGSVITRPLDTFLDSWSILRNMALTTQPIHTADLALHESP
jgi:subtilisin-like proprotein convertase family protein